VTPENSQVVGLEFVGLEVTKGGAITTKVLLEVQVRFQSKRLLGGEKSKQRSKQGMLVPSGCWLALLSPPTDCRRLTLELITQGGMLEPGGNKLGSACGPHCPAVAKELQDGVVEPGPEQDASR